MHTSRNQKKWTLMACLMVLSTFASAQNDAYVYKDGSFKLAQSKTGWQDVYVSDEGNVTVDVNPEVANSGVIDVFFTPFTLSNPLLRMKDYWGGAEMYQTSGHYKYKGYISSNRTDGVFINFFMGNNREYVLGPKLTSGNIQVIAPGTTYDLVRINKGEDSHYDGFVWPTAMDAGESNARPDMLDIDVWMADDGTAKIQINRVTNPRVYATGHFSNWKLENDQGSTGVYLSETVLGSMIFQGRISTLNATDQGFTIFAPRYAEDNLVQRITSAQPSIEGQKNSFTALTRNTWTTNGMQPYASDVEGGWNFPVQGIYDVTVDLSSSDRTKNRVKYEHATHSVTVNAEGYATYAPAFNVSPEFIVKNTSGTEINGNDVKLFYAPSVNNGMVQMNDIREVLENGHSIAQSEGLIVKAPNSSTVTFTYAGEEADKIEGNMFVGVIEDTARPADCTPYLFGKKNGKIGFYLWDPASSNKVKAYKSYLAIPLSAPAPAFYGLEGETTGIQSQPEATQETDIYNLSGQRISHMQRGVNIVNGKKVLF